MNEWVERSIKLANGPGYLDRLQEVYPVEPGGKRPLAPSVEEKISDAFKANDNKSLIEILLKQPIFPVKDPYVAFLRRNKNAIELNPQTVKRLGKRVRSLGLPTVLEAITAEKEINRQIGPLFHRWLPTLGYPFLSEPEFEASRGIAFLEGSEENLMKYVQKKFEPYFNKRPDFIAKARNTYIVGEAKFLTDRGGHQDRQFEEAMKIATGRLGMAMGVAVLDGVVWIPSKSKTFKEISKPGVVALSALLLKDFLEGLAE